jgi:hypothetical protein
LAIGLLLASTGTLAQVQNGQPDGWVGDVTSRANPKPVVELDPVQMPVSVPAEGGTAGSATSGNVATSKAGPVVSLTASVSELAGTSGLEHMVTPRGGAMMTPRQRADREIGRLIRRLD